VSQLQLQLLQFKHLNPLNNSGFGFGLSIMNSRHITEWCFKTENIFAIFNLLMQGGNQGTRNSLVQATWLTIIPFWVFGFYIADHRQLIKNWWNIVQCWWISFFTTVIALLGILKACNWFKHLENQIYFQLKAKFLKHWKSWDRLKWLAIKLHRLTLQYAFSKVEVSCDKLFIFF